MKRAYKPHTTSSRLKRTHGIRKSRTITIMVNDQPRIMQIPSEHSVAALREYRRRGQVTISETA